MWSPLGPWWDPFFGAQEGKEVEVSGHVHSQVYITVLDENDNSPRFDFTSDSAISVPEDCPVGQHVATVKARDPDAGSNGQVGTSEIVQICAVSEGSHSPSARGVTGAIPILSRSRSSRLCQALNRTTLPSLQSVSKAGDRAMQAVSPAWILGTWHPQLAMAQPPQQAENRVLTFP